MNSVPSIWNSWLTQSRQITYHNCRHTEYLEHADERDRVAGELRHMIENHYARSRDWIRLINAVGFSSLAEALSGTTMSLPMRTTTSVKTGQEQKLVTRRSDLCEMLAAEYAMACMGFEVPVRRLRYNPNRDQSMKGDDLLGFRFPTVHGHAAVLKGESKYRSSRFPSDIKSAVKEAYDGLHRSRRSYPVSMDFVANILELEQELERAQWVRQMRALLQSGRMPVERHYLIFLGTLGQPRDPFRWLDEQEDVVSNMTCVNIVFAPDFQLWLDELFGGD